MPLLKAIALISWILFATSPIEAAADSSAARPVPQSTPAPRLPFLRRYATPGGTTHGSANPSTKPRSDVKVTRPERRPASRSPASVGGQNRAPASHGKKKRGRPPVRSKHGRKIPAQKKKRPTTIRRAAPPPARPPVVQAPVRPAPLPTDASRQPARVAPPPGPPPAYMSSPSNTTFKPIPLHKPTKNGKEPDRTIHLDMTHPYLR